MRILIADDHVLFREALIQFISALRPKWVIETTGTYDDAKAQLDEGQSYDLIMLDLRMPGMNGLDGLEQMVIANPKQKVCILSGVAEDHHIKSAVKLGARAYFPKTLSGKILVKGIEHVVEGKKFIPMDGDGITVQPSYYDGHDTITPGNERGGDVNQDKIKFDILARLTPREKDVMEYIAQGLSNKDIARELDLQIATIKLHVSGLCKKLEVENRTQAAIMAHQYGLTSAMNIKK
jgi:two-component system nitrate/nitrite response regulator NarL